MVSRHIELWAFLWRVNPLATRYLQAIILSNRVFLRSKTKCIAETPGRSCRHLRRKHVSYYGSLMSSSGLERNGLPIIYVARSGVALWWYFRNLCRPVFGWYYESIKFMYHLLPCDTCLPRDERVFESQPRLCLLEFPCAHLEDLVLNFFVFGFCRKILDTLF